MKRCPNVRVGGEESCNENFNSKRYQDKTFSVSKKMGWFTRKATFLAKVNISINNISINHLWYYKIEMSSRLPYMWFTFYLYMLPCPFSHLPCVHYTFVQWYLPCLDICTQGQFQGPQQTLISEWEIFYTCIFVYKSGSCASCGGWRWQMAGP